jgi:flagellar FliL protein
MPEADNDLNLANLDGKKSSAKPKKQAAQPGEKKSMKKILLIAGAVLVLAGGGAAAYFLLPMGDAQDTAEAGADGAAPEDAQIEEEREALYLPLDPAFVITFDRPDGLRYLQVNLQVMSYDAEALEKVTANVPAVRNKLIMLFSSQDFEQLGTADGKEALRQASLQAIHEATPGKKKIDEVFFTGFVMQ